MSVTVIKKEVLSSDKIHNLKGLIYLPEGQPKGLFHVVHGMTEFIGRYEYFMTKMAEEGYICFGYDNLGHGETAEVDGVYGYFAHRDGWKLLAEDVKVFSDEMRKEYPDLPYYLLGHSMGSFIVRMATELFVTPKKLVIMGTGGKNPLANMGLGITRLCCCFNGGKKTTLFVQKMAFGSYNKRFPEKKATAWLTRDIDQEEYRKNNKFCQFYFTDSAMHDLIKLNKESNKTQWFDKMKEKAIPLALFSGSDDPVGNYGKGVKQVYNRLKKRGLDVELHIYEGYRHEVLNDSCRDIVRQDIVNFIEK